MLEEGYAAVTSRRVAAKAGLKPQLVHYYFRTMDDLFLEVFRSRAEANLTRFERAVTADPSLRTLWKLNSDPRGAAFTIEFVAMANHRKAIRAEIARLEAALNAKAALLSKQIREEKLSKIPESLRADVKKALDTPEAKRCPESSVGGSFRASSPSRADRRWASPTRCYCRGRR